MATPTTEIKTETNLQGILLTSLSTVGLTVQAQFTDNKTGLARVPQADTLSFTIDQDNANSETILATSHVTVGNVTTITIAANGRGIPKFGTGDGSGTGLSHVVGAAIGCVDIARPFNKIVQILGEKLDTAGGTFTGPIGFSGTTNRGITVSVLTTAQRDALVAPPDGTIIYNFSTGEYQIRQTGAWLTVMSGSIQPDGNETVAGKYQLPTETQIRAGTSLGSTGARLVLPNDTAHSFIVPTGLISPFGGTSAPAGWLLCDGTAVSRTTYADLFAVTGTAFGVGDGATTFNLPDLRGRAPYGKAAAGTYGTLGGTGGAETKNLAHTHTLTAAYAQLGIDSGSANDLRKSFAQALVTDRADSTSTDGASAGTTSDATALGGSTDSSLSATQDVTNPFQVVNYIIKT